MKNSVTTLADDVAGSGFRRVVRPWDRFWFTPADPTVLGLIRICCGLITLYTIAAYSFTLQDLFGTDAWVNLALREDARHNAPQVVPSLTWEGPPTSPVAENAEEQQYVELYMKKWGTAPPLPFPRDEATSQAIENYHVQWEIDPRLTQGKGSPIWSIWFHVTDPFQMALIHGVIVVIIFLFTIGFCTRLTSVLTWAGALCYIHRSPPTLFGVDTMMTILLLYLMIGPSGAALSVDRWLAGWWLRARPRILARWHDFWRRGTRPAASMSPAAGDLGPPAPSVAANFAIRLLQIHVCIIYLAAGLSKLQGASWWNGNAVWGTIANFEFAPMQYPTYMTSLQFLVKYRWLWEMFTTGGGYFTLTFEIAYVFLVWRPSTRWVILSMAIILHGFIGLFMGLKTFSLMMLVMNMAFLSPETVRLFLRPFSRGKSEKAPTEWPTAAPSPEPVAAGVPAGAFHAEQGRKRFKRKD